MGCCIPTDDTNHDRFRSPDTKTPLKVSKTPSHIILMGDSVLDDFYWLKDKHLDVTQQCKVEFGPNVNVHNFAVDECETKDILNGMRPSPVYVGERKQIGMKPYPISEDGKVYPLQCLKDLMESNKSDINTQSKPLVVLSVGGNDARIHLMSLINGNAEDVIRALTKNKFTENYHDIVDRLVHEFGVNVILVFVYQIQSRHMIYSAKQKVRELLKVMDYGYTGICKVAKEYKLPIIDLSRTFDPSNDDHYGSTEIEPSNLSGQFIVDLIRYVLESYDFEDGKRSSTVFYGLKGAVESVHVEKDNYLQFVEQRNKELKLI